MMEASITRCPCPIGADGKCEFVSLGLFPDKSQRVGPQEVIRCRHCGIGVTLPPLADVSFLYEDRASQDFQPDTAGLARRIKQIAFRRQAFALLRQLPERPMRALDFGCGSGLFTRCLGDILTGAEVVGSDYHSSPPAELVGRAYLPLAELSELAGGFDLVIAMHVLEHDDDALGLLERIVRMARPGGMVVIEVPNIDCIWTRIFGPMWDAWYTPFHRTHFSRASLVAIAKTGGLRVEAVHDTCVPTVGRTLANLAGAANGLPFLLAGIALHPLQWAGEKFTGRPSALRVIARRQTECCVPG